MMAVGSLRWSKPDLYRRPADDLLTEERVDVHADQLRVLESGDGARPVL